MNIETAILKLIDRNKRLVDKSGATDYTRETDSIINAVLEFYHKMKQLNKDFDMICVEHEKAVIIMTLAGVESMTYMDIEFLARYLENDVIQGIQAVYIEAGQKKLSDCTMTLSDIEKSYRNFKTEVSFQLEMFQLVKAITPTPKDLFPDLCAMVEREYTDDQAKDEIKRQLLYNFIQL